MTIGCSKSQLVPKHISKVRALPPAGGFVSPYGVLSHYFELLGKNPRSELEQALTGTLGCQKVILTASGKEALWRLLTALGKDSVKKDVLVAGYTCPDIASAVFHAGCRVVPFDIDPQTLMIKNDELSLLGNDNVLAVILSNLYGLPDELDPWSNTSCAIIDDACQAILSSDGDDRVGLRPNTIGVVSFGRGKPINALGGGAIISKTNPPISIDLSGSSETPTLNYARFGKSLLDLVKTSLTWLFGHPSLYRLPASLPFLKLGETRFQQDFRLNGVSPVAAAAAIAQIELLPMRAEINKHLSTLWLEALGPIDVLTPALGRMKENFGVVLTRFPILFSDKATRDRVFVALCRAGAGASISYGHSLGYFLKDHRGFVRRRTPGADEVGNRLLTLPLHQAVTERDITQTSALIRKIIGG